MQKTCNWSHDNYDYFETECGEAISFSKDCEYNFKGVEHLIESGVRYCIFCGKEINKKK